MSESPARQLELVTGRWVRFGVLAAVALLAFGIALELWGQGAAALGPVDVRQLGQAQAGPVWARMARLDGAALVLWGTALLLLLPPFRVVMALVGFARERDRLLASLAAAVLVLLAAGLALGYGLAR